MRIAEWIKLRFEPPRLDAKLAGIHVESLETEPVSWEVSFEILGERRLGITIPIVGGVAGEATVDT